MTWAPEAGGERQSDPREPGASPQASPAAPAATKSSPPFLETAARSGAWRDERDRRPALRSPPSAARTAPLTQLLEGPRRRQTASAISSSPQRALARSSHRARPCAAELRHRSLDRQERSPHIDGDLPIETRSVSVRRRDELVDAGAVHQDVHVADASSKLLNLVGIRQVGGHAASDTTVSLDRLHNGVAPAAVPAVQDDGRSSSGKAPGDRPPDPGRPPPAAGAFHPVTPLLTAMPRPLAIVGPRPRHPLRHRGAGPPRLPRALRKTDVL